MRLHNPENSHDHHIDQPPPASNKNENESLGFDAEHIVMEFFKSQFPGVEIRHATKQEDREHKEFGGKKIDAVLYRDSRPSAALQITTTIDSVVRYKKMGELKDHPFIRLDEMTNTDTAIPKGVIFIEPREVQAFLEDHDFTAHPKLGKQILDSLENSLKFDLLQTKNPNEKTKAMDMLQMIADERERLKKEDRTH